MLKTLLNCLNVALATFMLIKFGWPSGLAVFVANLLGFFEAYVRRS